MTWCPITGSDDPTIIQWSPLSGKNLRAKKRGEENWKYGSCSKAQFALALGQSLLEKEPEISFAEIQRRKMVEA